MVRAEPRFGTLRQMVEQAFGAPWTCANETESLLYQVVYGTGGHLAEHAVQALDVLCTLANHNLMAYCPSMPPEVINHVLMRLDNKRHIDALAIPVKSDLDTGQMAAMHKRIFPQYFPDYSIRLAKLLVVFLATVSVPEFTHFVRERSAGGESWDLMYMLLFLKLDAYKAGRPMGSRSRAMLSDGRGAEEKRRSHGKVATAASAATTASETVSSPATAAAAPISTPVARSVLPEYCGAAHAVLDMCMLYE